MIMPLLCPFGNARNSGQTGHMRKIISTITGLMLLAHVQAQTAADFSALFKRMKNNADAGILVNVHYIPIHLQPYYRRMGFDAGYLPEAEAYYARAISLPLYAGLSNTEQDYVIRTLKELVL